ncbi:tRNA uridine-5-carboxymethylaminomethyl(34) synthesis GTPase MnmE, partial [Bacillus haynesii]|nr:tRNA uridine-5-carboxymethylaminomethyl(34) synthesis GTPase MnmE [Bacillus haynesii]
GVERSRQVLKEADLILLVLNYSEPLSEEDIKLFEATKGMDIIVIVNKTDLEQKLDLDRVRELAGNQPVVTTSLLKEEGIDELEEAIQSLFFTGAIESGDLTYVSNTRHISLL